ncbi:MAG: sugar phosphate isomerase/epimerase [Opitutaceae bacterium]|nr:sugar phosphate isomerase/epimerase [Opitutaceae bacterium]
MQTYTRRDFAKLALSAVPAAGLLSSANPLLGVAPPRKARVHPNSLVKGVQIGINVPYSFGNPAMSGADVLSNCASLDLSAVELRAQPVETYMGAAPELIYQPAKGIKVSHAELEARKATLKSWRSSAPLARAKEFRKMYEDGGVKIEIVKVDNIFKLSDDELDYHFALAKTLGARAISSEISFVDDELKRVGRFADKHEFWVAYHGHTSTTASIWEHAFTLARYHAANVDLGHFVAGSNMSPVPFIKRHHERITHVHLKDRKYREGPNTPFGQGDTPIGEVLRLIRDNRWLMQGTIEFEYKVPEGSDRMREIARAIQYCRDQLNMA